MCEVYFIYLRGLVIICLKLQYRNCNDNLGEIVHDEIFYDIFTTDRATGTLTVLEFHMNGLSPSLSSTQIPSPQKIRRRVFIIQI